MGDNADSDSTPTHGAKLAGNFGLADAARLVPGHLPSVCAIDTREEHPNIHARQPSADLVSQALEPRLSHATSDSKSNVCGED